MYEDFTDRAPCQPFYFRQVLSGPHENFHYVIGDPATKSAAIIDPAFNLERLFGIVERDGYRIEDALFTHGHWDHIGGVPEIFDLGVKRIHVHAEALGHEKVLEAGDRCNVFRDGDHIPVGEIDVECLHTPGHQPESSCFLVDGTPAMLFGGDTLFVNTCGRTDFPGGDTDAMFASMARLRDLPGEVVVMPGHHYASDPHQSIANQRTANPAMATLDRDAFGQLHCLTN